MKISEILKEAKTFTMYQGLVRVGHTEEVTASEVADFVRAMPVSYTHLTLPTIYSV